MSYTYNYPRPAITVDAAVFRKQNSTWELLLIERGHPPYQGMWALPGGFVEMDETLEEAATRELKEESGITFEKLQQLRAYSAVDRDPRHRTISVVFTGILNNSKQQPMAGDDAAKVAWFRVNHLPPLAFDHANMVQDALKAMDKIS